MAAGSSTIAPVSLTRNLYLITYNPRTPTIRNYDYKLICFLFFKSETEITLDVFTRNKNIDLEDNIFVYLVILQVDTLGGALP